MTFDEVAAAVATLEAKGQPPTANRVLAHLGKGSKRDVITFLRAVRAGAAASSPPLTAVLDPNDPDVNPELDPNFPPLYAPDDPDQNPQDAPARAGGPAPVFGPYETAYIQNIHAILCINPDPIDSDQPGLRGSDHVDQDQFDPRDSGKIDPNDPKGDPAQFGPSNPAPVTRLQALRTAAEDATAYAQAYATHGDALAGVVTALEGRRAGYEKLVALATSGASLRELREKIEDLGFDIEGAQRAVAVHHQGDYKIRAAERTTQAHWCTAQQTAARALLDARQAHHALLGMEALGYPPLGHVGREQMRGQYAEARRVLDYWIGTAAAAYLLDSVPDVEV